MSNTGFKAYTDLEQYYLDNGTATGVTKPNTIGDPDYVAPVLDLIFCPLPLPSPSPTPTISVTPSISITPSITPTVTPSVTPSVSVTPSITPTISVTPSVPTSISVTPSISITPSVSISVTPSITVTPSPSSGYTPVVISAQGYMSVCGGGGCAEYLGWYIVVDQPVLVDTNYTLNIELYQYGIYQYTFVASGTIPAGSNNHNSDPCLGGGSYVGCNYTAPNTCVATIDAPVDRSAYAC